jgi:hypothetical protein
VLEGIAANSRVRASFEGRSNARVAFSEACSFLPEPNAYVDFTFEVAVFPGDVEREQVVEIHLPEYRPSSGRGMTRRVTGPRQTGPLRPQPVRGISRNGRFGADHERPTSTCATA